MSRPARILVVEDDPSMVKLICLKVVSLGYEVVGEAASETMAIRLARQFQPDLILMDILLENGDDGIETANKILTFADIAFVYLTAHEDEQLFQRARTTKPFGFLIKPFNDRDLNLVIETATYRQRQKVKLAHALAEAQNIINSSLVMIISVDRQNKITEFNSAAEWELGYTHQEVLGMELKNLLVDPDDLNGIEEKLKRGIRCELEIQFKHKSKRDLSCLLTVSRLHDSHNNSVGLLLISH